MDDATAQFAADASPQEQLEEGLRRLPTYTRSLLRVRIPVMVTLASTRTRMCNLLDMGPGSIIQFEKGCDELLKLEVGGFEVAEGEAVKIGDKFGLRVTQIVLPPERFQKVGRPPQT